MAKIEAIKRYFAALQINDIEIMQQDESSVSGRVWYERQNPEEYQDFCWHISNQNLPNESVLQLADVIAENKLVDIDQIKVPRKELYSFAQSILPNSISFENFESILEELLSIEISMVDEGKETDTYIIHE